MLTPLSEETEDHLSVVIAKADIKVEVDVDLHGGTTGTTVGESADNPADSCNHIANECATSPESGYYWVKSQLGPVGVYCEMNPEFNRAGGWRRVVGIDMTEEDTDCPEGLELITSPRRMCRRPFREAGCSSTTFSLCGLSYSKVCGKIIGYHFDSPDAFRPYQQNNALTIDDVYVDGVSITHGNLPRKHIWTLVAALDEVTTSSEAICPCTNTDASGPFQIPEFVGDNYYCETAHEEAFHNNRYTYLLDDPLWDGEGCGPKSTCCEGQGKPWFCTDLPEATTDDIEIRLCTDQSQSDEEFPLEIIELYVQ